MSSPAASRSRARANGGHARAVLRATIAAHRRTPFSEAVAERGLGPYRGYAEKLEAIDALVERGAELAVIGRSVRGEPLFALHLGAGREDRRARTAVVLSAVHPMEWIGVEAHLALLDRIVGVDLAGRSVVSVPIVNPDGVLRVENNVRQTRRRLVRHNARGVDLNRNFDARWGRRGLVQRLLWFLFAPGSRPASEPEVEAIVHELSQRRVDRALSLHSFGGVVLYPPAYSVWPVADAEEHRTWARRIARAADPRKPYRAISASWWGLGLVNQTGLELDWFHDRHGALSLLVECSRGGVSLRPSRLFEPFAWYNPAGLDAVTVPLAEALEPFVRGLRA